jgi:CRISPR/Cas system CSM-associated protein Csm3 (group 7 of RAMP superfamily)
MDKKAFKITAQSLLHTGADTKLGTISPFRKTKYRTAARAVKTRFYLHEKQLKRDAFALLYLKLWDEIPDKGRLTIYDEFQSKTLHAAYSSSKEAWLTSFCKSFQIVSVTEKFVESNLTIVSLLNLFSDEEFLDTIRNENQFLVHNFRNLKDAQRAFTERNKNSKASKEITKGDFNVVVKIDEITKKASPADEVEIKLFDITDREFFDSEQKKHYEYIPFVSGNSIRGKLRRIVMKDFCKAVGINEDKFNIEQDDEKKTFITFSPEWYHRLFTGGALNESNAFENIEEREKLIEFCPMLGLFGSAIGKQTIESCLNVSIPVLICRETGFEDAPSYHDLLTIDFGTRLDSEKTNQTIEIQTSEAKKQNATQMKYEIECLIAGSQFDAGLTLTSDDKLMKIVFQHAINLLVEEGNICAKKSIGYGKVSFDGLQTDKSASEKYYDYLNSKRAQILEFFKS